MEFLAGDHLPPPLYFTPRTGVVLHGESNSSESIFFCVQLLINFGQLLDFDKKILEILHYVTHRY